MFCKLIANLVLQFENFLGDLIKDFSLVKINKTIRLRVV